jgi:hypothetical protein
LPAAVTNGAASPAEVGGDDPALVGWRRIGWVETQFLRDPARHQARPQEVATLFAGIVGVAIGTAPPLGKIPFSDGDVSVWWRQSSPAPRLPPRIPLGKVVRLTRWTDWLDSVLVLIPPLSLRAYVDLRPPEYGKPLVWSDAHDAPAIVLRTWRIRNSDAFDADPFELDGSDLLARPDIFDRLQTLCGVPLQEVRTVLREQIPNR